MTLCQYSKKASGMTWGHYRPGSLMSILEKIMEKLIQDSVDKELNDRNIINSSQDGFMENRSR